MNKKKVILIILSVIIALAVLIGGIVFMVSNMLKEASTAENYKIDGQTITAITKVVGERSVTGISTKYMNGRKSKSYSYVVDGDPKDDVDRYVEHLCSNDGFVKDDNSGEDEFYGSITLYKRSDESTLMMNIVYDYAGYRIEIYC